MGIKQNSLFYIFIDNKTTQFSVSSRLQVNFCRGNISAPQAISTQIFINQSWQKCQQQHFISASLTV